MNVLILNRRGKWRLPVYEKPANTEINVEQIRFLKRLKDVWLFIRLLLPNDDELIADGSRASEALAVILSPFLKNLIPHRLNMQYQKFI